MVYSPPQDLLCQHGETTYIGVNGSLKPAEKGMCYRLRRECMNYAIEESGNPAGRGSAVKNKLPVIFHSAVL